MDKRGVEERIILWAYYLLLVAIVVVSGIFIINKATEASTFDDRFIAVDTSLLLDAVQLAPGKLNLNYNYGNRELNIEQGKVKSNNLFSSYQSNINQDTLIRKSKKNNLQIRNINFAFPVSQKVITSCFGNRNSVEKVNYHEGIDIRANYEDVVAVADGIIISYLDGMGTQNSLTIEHEKGVTTKYLHLDKPLKEISLDNNFRCIENCEVKKGEVIARSGQHGTISHTQYDPHLHFELIIEGKPRDPINYIFEPNDLLFKIGSNCFDNVYAYSYEIKDKVVS